MDVSDVIRDRRQEPGGLQGMLALSLLVHAMLAALLLLTPGAWLGRLSDETRTVMTISLGGGTPGPDSGGLTSIGGRPVQEIRPPDAPREALRPPAAKAPAMTVPEPDARPLPSASPTVRQAPDDARGRTPARGTEASEGSALAPTGVRGQGFGLSSGGGTGIGVGLDVANFCCPEYLMTMVQRIRSNWDSRTENPGEVVVMFTIDRSGALIGPRVEESSNVFVLDQNALRAVLATRQLPPLPAAFSNPTLTVHLRFQYTR
jgi:TonB family protein